MATLYHKGVRGVNGGPHSYMQVMPYLGRKAVSSGATGTFGSGLHNMNGKYWVQVGTGVLGKPRYMTCSADMLGPLAGIQHSIDWTGERWEIGTDFLDDIDLTFLPGMWGAGATLSYYQGPTDPDNPWGTYTATEGSQASGTLLVEAFVDADTNMNCTGLAALAVPYGISDLTGFRFWNGQNTPDPGGDTGLVTKIVSYDPETKWAVTNQPYITSIPMNAPYVTGGVAGVAGTPWEAASFFHNYDPETGEVSNPSDTLPGENDVVSFVGCPPANSPAVETTLLGITNLLSPESQQVGDGVLQNIMIAPGGWVEWDGWNLYNADLRCATERCELADCLIGASIWSYIPPGVILDTVSMSNTNVGAGCVLTGTCYVGNHCILGDGVIFRDTSAIAGNTDVTASGTTYFFDHSFFSLGGSVYRNLIGGYVWDSDSEYYAPSGDLYAAYIYMRKAVGQISNSRQACRVYVLDPAWTFPDPAGNITYDVSKLPFPKPRVKRIL